MMYKSMMEDAKSKGIATEKVMWDSIDELEDMLCTLKKEHPEMYWVFIKKTHKAIFGAHYNEDFGEWRIEQMFFKDKNGMEHKSPYWRKEDYRAVYEANKGKLKNPKYTCWDLAVTLEMLRSDNYCLYKSWWPEATDEQLNGKIIEAAINYLNDDDDMEGKIWHRFEK